MSATEIVKPFHALFMAMSPEEFMSVSICETAKEVWDILEITHEGTKTIKNSKLHMLTARFEEIRMRDYEYFDDFYAKLDDIVNSSFNLRKQIPEAMIVRKVMRFLPEKFRSKVTTIEESKDLDAIKIEELIVSLYTYELSVPHSRKEKSIVLREVESDNSNDEKLKDKDIAYLASFKKNIVKNKNISSKRYKCKSITSKKDKREKSNTRDSWKKFVRVMSVKVLVILNLSVVLIRRP